MCHPGSQRGVSPLSWRRRVLRQGEGRELPENTSELGQMGLEPRPPSFQARMPLTGLLGPTQRHSRPTRLGQLLPE